MLATRIKEKLRISHGNGVAKATLVKKSKKDAIYAPNGYQESSHRLTREASFYPMFRFTYKHINIPLFKKVFPHVYVRPRIMASL